MNIVYSRSARHFAPFINYPSLPTTIKQFSDGELYVKIDAIDTTSVTVIASTQAPAEYILELFFILDALQRQNIKIRLFLTYFGYARQDRAEPGEALSAEVICSLLKLFKLEKISIVHPHSNALQQWLSYEPKIPYDFFYPLAAQVDCIVAPDKGAHHLVETIAHHTQKQPIYLEKIRPTHEHVIITAMNGDVENKRILIVDDMISTGNTIAQATEFLLHNGATSVIAAITHNLCTKETFAVLAPSHLKKLYVTDSLKPIITHPLITVQSIGPFICEQISM